MNSFPVRQAKHYTAITNRYLDGFSWLITISPMSCSIPIVQRKCKLSLSKVINSTNINLTRIRNRVCRKERLTEQPKKQCKPRYRLHNINQIIIN